jgi:hypothetical protein
MLVQIERVQVGFRLGDSGGCDPGGAIDRHRQHKAVIVVSVTSE